MIENRRIADLTPPSVSHLSPSQAEVRAPQLLNSCPLRREHLPASVPLDEHVRKARP